MIDANLVRIVAAAGMISPGDRVIEVGPGTGTLTEELLSHNAQVVAVEIDRALADLLRRRFASADNFTLIEGDALAGKHALDGRIVDEIGRARSAGQTVRLVANLPYNIASSLLIEMLIAGVDLLAFTVQKEVADRLAQGRTPPNMERYRSWLSFFRGWNCFGAASASLLADAEDRIGPGAIDAQGPTGGQGRAIRIVRSADLFISPQDASQRTD